MARAFNTVAAWQESDDKNTPHVERTAATGNARLLVQVYNAGSLPNQSDHIFLTHPVDLDGDEIEGGLVSSYVDTGTSIPVLAIGSAVAAGDILVATAVGGRWVVEKTLIQSPPSYACLPCSIPETTLTLSWENVLLGNGSVQLDYTAPGIWVSECTNDIQFQVRCTGNQVELRVVYYLSGACPSGQSQYCSNLLPNPLALVQTIATCEPLFVVWTLDTQNCPTLISGGYSAFALTE